MSILADKTDFKVLKIISKCLKQLDEINSLNLRVTKIDDFEISLATNMLKSVIDNNELTIIIKPPKKPLNAL
jgi:stage III sporulation protein SpoIIIAA